MTRGYESGRSADLRSRWRVIRLGLLGLLAVGVVALAILAVGSTRSTADPTATAGPIPTFGADRVVLPTVGIVGDSYTAGTQMDSGPAARWPALLGAELEFRPELSTRGGVGYVTSTARGVNFGELASRIGGNPQVVIVFGSRNDQQGYQAVHDAAAEAYAVILQVHADAKVLVVGPPWPNANPPSWLVEARDATRDAAAEAGVTYVDPLAEAWFTDAGLIGDDTVHPTDAGHARIADALRPHVTSLLSTP